MRTFPQFTQILAETTEDDRIRIDDIDDEFGEEAYDEWGLENI
jgi:hypothetical protein